MGSQKWQFGFERVTMVRAGASENSYSARNLLLHLELLHGAQTGSIGRDESVDVMLLVGGAGLRGLGVFGVTAAFTPKGGWQNRYNTEP